MEAKTARWENGLEDTRIQDILFDTERELLSQGLLFTTKEAVKHRYSGYRDSRYNCLCFRWDIRLQRRMFVSAFGSTVTDAQIQSGTTTTRDVHEISVKEDDTIFIEDNRELNTWVIDEIVNKPLTIEQWKTYSFVRVTPGFPMRIVAEADCVACSTGEYTSIPAAGVVGDIEMGTYQHWRPTEAGTYYYVSPTISTLIGV